MSVGGGPKYGDVVLGDGELLLCEVLVYSSQGDEGVVGEGEDGGERRFVLDLTGGSCICLVSCG